MKRTGFHIATVALLLALGLVLAADTTPTATVQFKFDFPHSNPAHYEITVQSDGRAAYLSNGDLGNSTSDDTEPFEFSIAEKTRRDIFELAKKANYFSGKVDSGNTRIANMGSKTLIYKDGAHNTSATYNYSLDPAVQQITGILQDLSTVLEFGRRLTWFHKYQKLALEDDLKQMEDRQRSKTLGDLEPITPVLKQIANDQAVMRMTRARALRLLAAAGQ
ncbi:MAG TPA: hypothetical protein VL156_17265 [Terriglobales bacterium]|jgi:hypothetical protein|nr:hypothetical protein [Terriglobales bacterium]